MSQPKWKYLGNLGDTNPLQYGGYFIFEDTTGHYPPEGEYYFAPDGDREGEAYRIMLEKMAMLPDGRLVNASLLDQSRRPLPYAIETYVTWFNDKIPEAAESAGMTADALRAALCSDDILSRAAAYENLANYFGWFEFDPEPRTLTEAEAAARYDPIKLNGMTGE